MKAWGNTSRQPERRTPAGVCGNVQPADCVCGPPFRGSAVNLLFLSRFVGMTCGAHQDDVVPALRRLRARPPGQSNGKGFQGTAPCRCPDSRKGLTSRARSSPAGADPGTPGFAGSAGASLQGRASATESGRAARGLSGKEPGYEPSSPLL